MNPKDILKEFLTVNKVMQLATVGKNGPWICTLYFVIDDQNNIYWTSARNRQHSREILDNSKVAATVVHDPVHKRAVQITGEAHEVPLSDVERINKLYADKFGDKPSRLQEVIANRPDGRAYWVLKPQTISLWDEVVFPDKPKRQV
jgi:uncharacterized protein YhbP (UPF0306 family)